MKRISVEENMSFFIFVYEKSLLPVLSVEIIVLYIKKASCTYKFNCFSVKRSIIL